MKSMQRTITVLSALSLLAAGWAGPVLADEHTHHPHGGATGAAGATPAAADDKVAGHSHERCELHGGQVSMTTAHHFETVFGHDGIRVYMYSDQQMPMVAETLTAKATLKFKNGTTKEISLAVEPMREGEKVVSFCPMHPDQTAEGPGKCPKCGMNLVAQTALLGAVDLSKVPPNTLKATIEVKGMEGKEPLAAFTETFRGWAPAAQEKEAGHTGHEHGKHEGH